MRRAVRRRFMKSNALLIGSLATFLVALCDCACESDFPILRGPYLGQKPPGMTPEIFAPGIISLEDRYELNSEFSPSGDEFYFELSTSTQEEKQRGIYFYVIMVSKRINGVWTKPEMMPFSGVHATMDHCLSPDGKRLYFTSDRPNAWDTTPKNNIWYVERTGQGWSDPAILPPPIYRAEVRQGQVSIAANGTVYFRMGDDLFYSEYSDGEFTEPVILPEVINSPYAEGKPFVAPDESFLLFNRYEMPDSLNGGRGPYISFKGDEGNWTPAINTNLNGSLPKFTPDMKYFFFSRGGDIWWVDAELVYRLKPSESH